VKPHRRGLPKEPYYRLIVHVQVKIADIRASHRLPIKTIYLQELDSREGFTSFFHFPNTEIINTLITVNQDPKNTTICVVYWHSKISIYSSAHQKVERTQDHRIIE